MAKRSLKASPLGINQAKKAFERIGWTQEYLAAEVGLSTRQPVWKFFSGKPIERNTFIDLCFQLSLDWQDIADSPPLPPREKSDASLEPKIATSTSKSDRLVSQVRSQISGQIEAQCSTIQSFFEFAQPLDLDNIYTEQNVLTRLSNQRWLEISDLQSSRQRSLADLTKETIPALKAVTKHQKLMLLGKPGAGKTTFLQYLALECIREKFKADCVPVFIPLRTFVLQAKECEDFSLLGYLNRFWDNYNLSATEITTLLQQGKVLILLDGLDEIPPEYEQKIFQQILQFSQLYYQNSLVITCRLAGQQYRFNGLSYVELADFNRNQVEIFAQKWFIATAYDAQTGKAKAQQFLEQLQDKNNQAIRELVSTPILLNLICSVFQERLSFPDKRARLYQEGLDILLVRWDRSRGIERDSAYHRLALADKIKLLSHIAAVNFEQDRYFLEAEQLLQTIADYLATLANFSPDPESLRLDSQEILRAIEIQHGLLIERARGIYSFSHLTFQEYLTARKIVSSLNPEELNHALEQLASHITNPQWREVILLTASMLSNADYLIQQLKKQVDTILQQEPLLQKFLQFINQKTEVLSIPYKPAAVRAFYFSLFSNRDLNLPIALDSQLAKELPNDLALDLALEKAYDLALSLVKNPNIKQILNFSFALEFESNLILSPDIKQALNNLKKTLPDPAQGKEYLLTWWLTNGDDWVNKFRQAINEYRYFDLSWNFNSDQQELLHKYYINNQFLLQCLDSNFNLTFIIQKTTKDTFFLGK
ncbi:NACHT domain-containing NTPase [Waterburya agarophytonicola K14]|uniref:NACHT domain-containing NTPase n=1 Tax=Waterburya agarophytonicola KI4 TaxID=2874699 RepID=A0A964BUW4_9CYAN|nr:NACHT domain-containing NTPase [Waterburya agarophytonicola]MCC0179226.1 NACHT domain-containing NTPase [Waterburya agarophytonicola KI4]